MLLFKWLARRGFAGQTARTIVRQYVDFRRRDPVTPVNDFYAHALGLRHVIWAYTPYQVARLNAFVSGPTLPLAEFIATVVFVESDWGEREITERGHVIREIVHEVLTKEGLCGSEVFGE